MKEEGKGGACVSRAVDGVPPDTSSPVLPDRSAVFQNGCPADFQIGASPAGCETRDTAGLEVRAASRRATPLAHQYVKDLLWKTGGVRTPIFPLFHLSAILPRRQFRRAGLPRRSRCGTRPQFATTSLLRAGLPRRSRCGKGGSNPVKLDQTGAFGQNAGKSYAATLPSTTCNSNSGSRRFGPVRPGSTWFD